MSTLDRLGALASLLVGKYRLSQRLVKDALSDMLGVEVSVGSVVDLEGELADALAPSRSGKVARALLGEGFVGFLVDVPGLAPTNHFGERYKPVPEAPESGVKGTSDDKGVATLADAFRVTAAGGDRYRFKAVDAYGNGGRTENAVPEPSLLCHKGEVFCLPESCS